MGESGDPASDHGDGLLGPALSIKLCYKKDLDEDIERAIEESLWIAAETCYKLDQDMEAVRRKIQKRMTRDVFLFLKAVKRGKEMRKTTEMFMGLRSLFRLYDKMLKKVCTEHDLTVIEADIISFLQNNPGKDTAADIVELRGLSKGAVSKAVECLIQNPCWSGSRTRKTEERSI